MDLDEEPAGSIVLPVWAMVFGSRREIGFAVVDGDTVVIRVTEEIAKDALNGGAIKSLMLIPQGS